ncbi:restriction endonuclease subunit S [Lactobacillus delbrueckii]|uniref:restriction endonuclease subunit S n=2 Tax=Lactobacillus delbrueckii TaxID=1584 RepID=UPI0003A3D7F4|nr:restriction endonuclease subunit S [Lactobacillus delbrueckii]
MKFEDFIELHRGYDLPKKQRKNGQVPVIASTGINGTHNVAKIKGPGVVTGRSGSIGKVQYIKDDFWPLNTTLYVSDFKGNNPKFVAYWLERFNLKRFSSGSAVPTLNRNELANVEICVPNREEQDKIVAILEPFEKKIELNQEINDNLDELSTVIFDRWIRNSSSDVKCPLDHVAKYTNGLAMQKFRPQNNEIGLPVVKIRELNQGDTDENSDYCTSNIDQSVKVNTGDIIFSWSGTLTLDIWAGGEAGLNQHLFKVTSSKYPYWFVFEWTKYYLKSFQNIAKSKATTMGHIKRSDLHSSLVKIPTHDEMIELNTTLSPMYSQKIAIRHENRVLYQMKQQLLSKYF